MSKVLEIGIAENTGSKMLNVSSIEALAGKGLLNDRKFMNNNNNKSQLTFIEIENINYVNKILVSKIPAINFRRNIITQGVNLNDLNGKEFFVGPVKVKAHDLCRPCKYLQQLLNQKNLMKELLLKGGLRCEILVDGKISIGDIIKIHD
tara:strand:+ start:902 stop:1348 length:447 start_codon:yes stop_codon:yes gene_type:complete